MTFLALRAERPSSKTVRSIDLLMGLMQNYAISGGIEGIDF